MIPIINMIFITTRQGYGHCDFFPAFLSGGYQKMIEMFKE